METQQPILATLRSSVPTLSALLEAHRDKGRNAIGRTVCEAFGLMDARGRPRQSSCVKALRVLASEGHITLPETKPAVPYTGPRLLDASVPAPTGVEDLEVVLVTNKADRAIWNTLMDREHPRGTQTFAGAQRKYLIKSAHGYLGAVGFSAAALYLKPRDAWITWSQQKRGQHLHRVVNLSRFLIRPGVQCRNLASHVLSLVLRRLPDDFQARYHYAPYLVEVLWEKRSLAPSRRIRPFNHITWRYPMRQRVFLGLDAHVRHCVLAGMDMRGKLLFSERLPTSEAALKSHLVAIRAHCKILALEESSLADWLAGALRDYVDDLIVCDPRQNKLISRSAHKSDREDAYNLCRLLRLGELKPVYHAQQAHRALFKDAVQHYIHLRDELRGLKCPIKAKYHHAGVLRLDGSLIFSETHREQYLGRLSHGAMRARISRLYPVLDEIHKAKEAAHDAMIRMGRRYPEIKQFMRMPGMGPIGAHVFDAFIQMPHRFTTRQKLWQYCKLGIVQRSSAGKPLAYKRLDRAGIGELKAVSYRAFRAAIQTRSPNEVSRFYEASLCNTHHNETRARLNTQRKILAVLWTIWRKDVTYNPDLLFSSTPTAAAVGAVA